MLMVCRHDSFAGLVGIVIPLGRLGTDMHRESMVNDRRRKTDDYEIAEISQNLTEQFIGVGLFGRGPCESSMSNPLLRSRTPFRQ